MPNEPTPVERISPPVNKIGEVFFIEQRITQRYDPIKKKIVTSEEPFQKSISQWSDGEGTVFITGEVQKDQDQQVASAIEKSRIAKQNWGSMTPAQQQREVEKFNRFIEDPYYNPMPNSDVINICSQQYLQIQYEKRLREIKEGKM